ncbi:3-hydroxyacyl-ACP dehydratase FabZ [Bartonella sp. DGB2]|uniref:3-hydroxyacyl-ACP dehydratase FabZ n=1 Tax=Bartonella sp. DGB2 TaxID=3388426 RepID=UPI00398FFCC0
MDQNYDLKEDALAVLKMEAADIRKILSALPHRYPFLLIDRLVEIEGDQSAVALKNVTMNEPHFAGHFPENPVMPGVLIIEAMAQAAGALSILAEGVDKPKIVYLMTIDKAKFRKPVQPGDQLRIYVTKVKQRAGMRWFSCIAKVEGICVAEAEIGAMVAVET